MPEPFLLRYLTMKVSLIAQKDASLPPFLGSTLRGVIGHALYSDRAAYQYLYHNRTINDDHRDTVNPYVIVPPAMGKTDYHKGEHLNFQLLLFGDAERFARALLMTLHHAQPLCLGAGRYPFVLAKVTNVNEQRVIWERGMLHDIAARGSDLPCLSLPCVTQATVRTVTPLRIRNAGALRTKVDFPVIFRNIASRMTALTARYGGWVDQLEIGRLQMLAESIATVQDTMVEKQMERFSNRLDSRMEFNGLMGALQFEGDLSPFVPWLYAAQVFHIGRNTTFGMGQIEVEFT